MHYLFSLALLAFVSLVSMPAEAKSPMGKNWYGAISVGAVAFTHETSVAHGEGVCYSCRNVMVKPSVGYNVSGSLGGWMNDAQRTEISAGYRSYKIDFAVAIPVVVAATQTTPASVTSRPITTYSSTANVIPVLVNNYFYPMTAFPSVPQAHQPYFGFGLGVGLWSFTLIDASGVVLKDSYTNAAFMGTLSAGYDFYLDGLKNMVAIPAMLRSMAVGINYQFSWSNPKPFGDVAVPARTATFNQSINQSNHIVSATLRFEF